MSASFKSRRIVLFAFSGTLAKCGCTECTQTAKTEQDLIDKCDMAALSDNNKQPPVDPPAQRGQIIGEHISENIDDFAKLSLVQKAMREKLGAAVNLRADSPSVLSCDMCEQCSLAGSNICNCRSRRAKHFKPILLIIPLRLGLSEINSVYTTSLKVKRGCSRVSFNILSTFMRQSARFEQLRYFIV